MSINDLWNSYNEEVRSEKATPKSIFKLLSKIILSDQLSYREAIKILEEERGANFVIETLDSWQSTIKKTPQAIQNFRQTMPSYA